MGRGAEKEAGGSIELGIAREEWAGRNVDEGGREGNGEGRVEAGGGERGEERDGVSDEG